MTRRRAMLAVAAAYGAFAQKRDFDFTKVRTFTVRPGTVKSKVRQLREDAMEASVRRYIAERLKQTGLVEADHGEELFVNFSLTVEHDTRRITGVVPRNTRRPVHDVVAGRLLISIRESSSRELVWQTFPSFHEDTPREFELRLPKHVERALSKFPPKRS